MEGPLEPELRPSLERDVRDRLRLADVLARLGRSPWTQGAAEDPHNAFELGQLDAVEETLRSGVQRLAPPAFEGLRALASTLTSLREATPDGAPQYAADIPDRLNGLADEESGLHPTDGAAEDLRGTVPEFIFFQPGELLLNSTYDLEADAYNPPPALRRFARLAGLDLGDLRDEIVGGFAGTAEGMLIAANDTLNDRLRNAWEQSAVSVRLNTDGTVLRIFVSTDGGGYQDIAERSDGMRTFIALLGFTRHPEARVPPVLLVDEAETHLHYDAQADLVQMLGRQVQAAQVIYT